jgi:hypothetical protein
VLNQYCSETSLKILFQQYRPISDLEAALHSTDLTPCPSPSQHRHVGGIFPAAGVILNVMRGLHGRLPLVTSTMLMAWALARTNSGG